MASPSLFEYRTGVSLLHRLDPRIKLALVCLFSLTTTVTQWPGSLLMTCLLGAGLSQLHITIFNLLKAFRFFILFLGIIILTRGLMVPGNPIVEIPGFCLSSRGLALGSLVALRFFNMMVLGLIFCATTRPSDLNAALQWIARPIPFIPEKRMGMIFSLSLRFLPLIFHQAGETADAFNARNGQTRKNPIKRTIFMGTALMTRVFCCADAAAMAMEARCYTDSRTMIPFKPCGREKRVFLAGTGLCIILLWL